ERLRPTYNAGASCPSVRRRFRGPFVVDLGRMQVADTARQPHGEERANDCISVPRPSLAIRRGRLHMQSYKPSCTTCMRGYFSFHELRGFPFNATLRGV